MLGSRKYSMAFHTDVTVADWSTRLGVIVRQEQALETIEMSDWFCGLRVHASMSTEAGVMNCLLSTKPAVVVTVAVPV